MGLFIAPQSDVFSCFKMFHKMIATQFDAKVRILRTDNGREYVNNEFQDYLAENGTINQAT